MQQAHRVYYILSQNPITFDYTRCVHAIQTLIARCTSTVVHDSNETPHSPGMEASASRTFKPKIWKVPSIWKLPLYVTAGTGWCRSFCGHFKANLGSSCYPLIHRVIHISIACFYNSSFDLRTRGAIHHIHIMWFTHPFCDSQTPRVIS